MSLPNFPSSPDWNPSSKRQIILFLVIVLMLFIYRVRILLPPFILALLLAYLVEPLVNLITRRTPVPRILTIVLIYLLIIAALVAIPISAIPPVISQANGLINNIPVFIQQLNKLLLELQEPIYITDEIIIPLDQLPLDQALLSLTSNLVNIVQGFGGQTITIFGNVLGASVTTVGWVILILFLSFYMVKDHEQIFRSFSNLAPPEYQADLRYLSQQFADLWNAFLRGQLVLCFVVGLIVFFMAIFIGLPNALLLALIAGLMEFIPTLGPVLAAIPAIFLGYFQANNSWVGQLIGPFWFVVLIAIFYIIIYQLENYYLLPRIIGYRLQLHPIVVVLGAIAGASIAGILGIILAAPTLASARILFFYVYKKLTGHTPFPPEELHPIVEAPSRLSDSDSSPQASEI